MIDPTTWWFEIIELPNMSIKYICWGEEIVDGIIDKSLAQISWLFNKQCLSHYPCKLYVIYDIGSEFKLHFKELCDSYQLKCKPTTVKNPQANAILECMHGVLADMMQTSGIDMSQTVDPDDIDAFLTNAV